MTFVAAFAQKQGRNWRIISGLLGIIAGIIILTYPISSAVTLALIGGIWLIILGITQIVAGFQLRRPAPGLTPRALRAILSPGAVPGARDARGLDDLLETRRSSLRRSSVVERAAVNRLVVGSSPTAGANSCPGASHVPLDPVRGSGRTSLRSVSATLSRRPASPSRPWPRSCSARSRR